MQGCEMGRRDRVIRLMLVLLLSASSVASGQERERESQVRPQATAAVAAAPAGTPALATVEGEACYQYGDNETPLQGKATALALAQQRAIESHQVYVESATKVANFQLTDDVIKSLSRASLHQMKIVKEEQQGQKTCVAIRALLDPAEMSALINQRINAKEVTQAVQVPLLSAPSAFRLKVWTNKDLGAFREGERLIMHVWSERDAYLKLDYYQANGEVVHLVPNLFGQQAFIRAGQTYSFGVKDSPYEFIIRPPFGSEALKVLASSSPFSQTLLPGTATADAREYLGELQRGVRGIELRLKDSSSGTALGPGALAEAVVTVNTVEKE